MGTANLKAIRAKYAVAGADVCRVCGGPMGEMTSDGGLIVLGCSSPRDVDTEAFNPDHFHKSLHTVPASLPIGAPSVLALCDEVEALRARVATDKCPACEGAGDVEMHEGQPRWICFMCSGDGRLTTYQAVEIKHLKREVEQLRAQVAQPAETGESGTQEQPDTEPVVQSRYLQREGESISAQITRLAEARDNGWAPYIDEIRELGAVVRKGNEARAKAFAERQRIRAACAALAGVLDAPSPCGVADMAMLALKVITDLRAQVAAAPVVLREWPKTAEEAPGELIYITSGNIAPRGAFVEAESCDEDADGLPVFLDARGARWPASEFEPGEFFVRVP